MIRALTPEELADLVTDGADAGFGAIATEKGCLPLRSLGVDVRIDGLTAATTVRQQFVNGFDGPLEATYIFPLPPRAAVTGFRMLVDGGEVRGRIDERGRARRDYAHAVAEGRQAAIVEEERPDVFTLRVGNIPARSAAVVEFTLVAPVTVDLLEATYRFPLVVAPRYCPGEVLEGDALGDGFAFDTDLVPDASRISPPILLPGMKSPVRLAIAVRMAPNGSTAASTNGLACSLPADESVDGDGLRTITVVPDQRLDRDFILRWKVGDGNASTSVMQIEPDAVRSPGLGTAAAVVDAAGEGTFAVSIVPPAVVVGVQQPRDVVFLLDRSGSMRGWQMVAARRAVARIIDSLSAIDRVAVIAFDDRLEHGAGESALVCATDRNRWRLLEWLSTVESRGGTAIAPAIAAGLALCGATGQVPPSAVARSRCVVLVTDAQVGDEDRVLRELAAKLGDARLFVVGIDNAINEGLISRMADASGGLVELVESEDRLDAVLERIQARIQPPLVRDLSLTGVGIELIPDSIVPVRVPDLVAGLPLVLRGRYRSASPGATVRVEGTPMTGDAWQTVAAVAGDATPGLGSLWARGMLRRLEDAWVTGEATVDEIAEVDEVEPPKPDTEPAAASLESRLVALSTSFGVLCRFTALVAIDDRNPHEPAREAARRRVVQPVDASSHLEYCAASPAFQARRSGLLFRRKAPPPDVVEDGFFCLAAEGEVSDDALSLGREQARRLLARIRPRSGRVADLRGRRVSGVLARVLKLMRQLGKHDGATDVVERLAAAYARLYARPADAARLAELLEVVAAFAEEGGLAVSRWWLPSPPG